MIALHVKMPGKLKARTYDLSQTNVAMIGTSLDKATRKAAAETEAAWHGAGTEFGILIWRIEKFNVVGKGSEIHCSSIHVNC